MSSDRARVSYDPKRYYRSVVAQQGRVTLEADVNEAQEIAGETLRLETIDVVGASGTPDDGYKISAGAGANPGHDFKVGHGTMYVGGERVSLPADITYAAQPEWLDHGGDPLWPAANNAAKEFVYLLLREQEVSAVEDTALREVALGGPDNAQRKRLIQRVVRMPVTGDTCAASLQTAQTAWTAGGLSYSADNMTLRSPAKLLVALINQPTTGNVCEPQAQGGYLGADNQLIRVQISDINGNGGKLLWGYNNASFLHRAKFDTIGSAQLDLLTTPVDSYHAPRAGHPIELLRCAVQLSADPADVMKRDYVAAHAGYVVTPTASPSDDLKSLVLTASEMAALPASYKTNSAPLFVRLWDEELNFTSGTPVTLAGTGLTVTIALGGSAGKLSVGQYWMFAVRPNEPAEVYPRRYLLAPQPPEGPRQWACPLATIGWTQNTLSMLEDCRAVFDNLVELTKRHVDCCGITVGPADVRGGAGLQDLLDKLAGQKITVALKEGTYALMQPLKLIAKHSNLTLEGCHTGAVLAAKAGAESRFDHGLIQLYGVKNVELRRLQFNMPMARSDSRMAAGKNPAANVTAVAIQSVDCVGLRIEECTFVFPGKSTGKLYAAGIVANGDSTGMAIQQNRFVRAAADKAAAVNDLTLGIAAMSGIVATDGTAKKTINARNTLLDDVRITCNEFSGLTMAVYARADLGHVYCDDNVAIGCTGGFYFVAIDLNAQGELLAQAYQPTYSTTAAQVASDTAAQSAQVAYHADMMEFAKLVPLEADQAPDATLTIGKALPAAESKILATQIKERMALMVSSFAEAKPSGTTPARAPAPGAAGSQPIEGAAMTMPAGSQPEQPAFVLDSKAIRDLIAIYTIRLPADHVGPVPRLRLSCNSIEILPVAKPDTDNNPLGARPMAIYVILPQSEDGSVMAIGNRLNGASVATALALIELLGVATVTGNMILNAAGEKNNAMSLYLMAYPPPVLMNVSGNILRGKNYIFPQNPPDAGCVAVSWDALNSRRV